MPAIYEQYTEELRNKFGYLATWLPNTKLKLGDIGVLKRDRFEYYTNLDEVGISFDVRNSNEAANLEYSSKGAVQINFEAAGSSPDISQIPAHGETGLSIFFNRANAIMFIGRNCKNQSIQNLDSLGKEIMKRYKAGKWKKEYVIVTELVKAEVATILISNSSNARIDFKIAAGLNQPAIAMTDISGKATVTNINGIDTKIISVGQLTPLFRASGLRTRFLKDTQFETRSSDSSHKTPVDQQGEETMIFSDIEYEDFEK